MFSDQKNVTLDEFWVTNSQLLVQMGVLFSSVNTANLVLRIVAMSDIEFYGLPGL